MFLLVQRRVVWAFVVLMVATGLSGCLGEAPSAEIDTDLPPLTNVSRPSMPDLRGLVWQTIVTDPAGDALAEGTGWARSSVGCPWSTDPALRDIPIEESCYTAIGSTAAAPDAGVPGHPSLDLLAVDVAEHPDSLVVAFTVSEVRQDLEGSYKTETGESAFWVLRLTGAAGCSYSIEVYAIGVAAGTIPTGMVHVLCPPGLETDGPFGNCALSCAWKAAMVVEPGAPGRIVVAVPRWVFGADPGLATIVAARTYSWGDSGGYGTQTALVDGFWINPGGAFVADDATPEDGTSFLLNPAVVAAVDGFAVDDSGRVGAGPAAGDGRRFTRHEAWADGELIHMVLDLASLPEADANTTLLHGLVLDGALVYVTVDSAAAGWQASGTAYLQGFEAIGVPVAFTVEPGSPGRISLSLQRNQLPEPGASDLAAWGYTLIMERASDVVDAGPAASASSWGKIIDFLPPGPPLRLPPVPELPAHTQRFQDAFGDAAYPPDALSGDPRSMDIELIEFASDDPEVLRITMALAGAGNFETPTGYDAMFFAVGIEHPQGTTMIGHYRSPDRREGVFLCAPDTTVLPATPLDPTLGGWTDIRGRILQTSGGRGLGGESPSASIVAFAPRSCFDMREDDRELNATALGAGTYLIRRGGAASIATVDTWRSNDATTLAYAMRPAAPTPFSKEPFGIENFWDIMGIILAVATVLGTGGVVYRRRRMLRVYLAEIRTIQDEHANDPARRAELLVAVRARLHKDLVRHRLTDSHFPIVMDRLRSRLTSARLTSMGEAFYHLPPPLAMRLERLLDDGHLSSEEGAILRPLLERTTMSKQTRAIVLACIDKWVREDSEESRT